MNDTAMHDGGRRRTAAAGYPRAIIAVSRQHGARAAAVARMVAERLGYVCWDRKLVGAIASQAQLGRAQVAALDERGDGSVADETEAAAHGRAARPGRSDYLRGLSRVAHTLGRRGSAVIVGRGIGFMLDPAECLRVRVVCPLEQRIAGLAERSHLEEQSARATIHFVDRERREFVRDQHRIDDDDPENFDLVVSTGALSLDAVADIIVAAYRVRFDRPPPAGADPRSRD